MSVKSAWPWMLLGLCLAVLVRAMPGMPKPVDGKDKFALDENDILDFEEFNSLDFDSLGVLDDADNSDVIELDDLNFAHIVTPQNDSLTKIGGEYDKFVCELPGRGIAHYRMFRQRAYYLKTLKDTWCVVPPGPGVCARPSCAFKIGIWMCNHTDKEIRKPCPVIAKNAVDVINKCKRKNAYLQGELFINEGYSVVLSTVRC